MEATKTRAKIDVLKRQWEDDPCWDIETTEGFEANREELLAYRLQKEAEWTEAHNNRMLAKADKLGCPGNIRLAEYITRLERQIERINEVFPQTYF